MVRYTAFNVVALAWHPTSNTLSFTTSQGQLYRWKDCIPSTHPQSYGSISKAPKPISYSSDPPSSRSPSILSRGSRGRYFDEDETDDDAFIVDDDGAGYVPSRKRRMDTWGDPTIGDYPSKRGRAEFQVKIHEPFQSGSTPWKGNRRYLSTSRLLLYPFLALLFEEILTCLACNMIGHVWTVDQDTHNTVTCEFYDREAHHQFFFTDVYLYDKACLSILPSLRLGSDNR